ncbi:MAG TPA: prolyl oligopeptidase family serine peptidase [Longimicrobiales bacterium]|nr:prolyl oligopeptidase family serine peptidase [Longimicrobiales bacterium]
MPAPSRAAPALALLAALVPAAARAQAPPAFDLSVLNIMRGPELVGEPPQQVAWSDDGRWIFFRWKPGGRPWSEEPALYRAPAAGGAPERLSDAAADSLGILAQPGDISADRRWRVSAFRGDLYRIDRRSLAVLRLTDTRATESDPVFSGDGRTVYFLRGGEGPGNVFALGLRDGGLRQLTDLRVGSAPDEKKPEGQRKYLEEEQKELLEHLRLQAARKAHEDSLKKAREAREPKTTYLEKDERVLGLAVDPSGRWAAVEIGKPAKDARKAIVPDYVTLSGYTEPKEVRTKVGDAEEEGRLGLVDLGTGAVTWLDPAADAPAADTADRPRHGRFATAHFLGWTPAPDPDGAARPALGLVATVSYDYKDQWLGVLDPKTGKVTVVAHDHDDAWIGGPCETWAERCAGWLPNGRTIWFLSERDGYSHLYQVGADGQGLAQITRGAWEVVRAVVSPARDRFFLTTSEGSPFEQHVWTMALRGGPRTRITPAGGLSDATVAPDGKRLALVRSLANRPPELFLAEARAGAPLRQVTTSPTAAWLSYHWIEPEIVTFNARDGVEVPARIYRPRDVGARPNGAGVIFVHGAGYLHNVTRGWSTYSREYMFHHLLASRGYTVLDVDYRGSAGYGRAWRTAIYRHMGGKDLTDQLDGLRYLGEHEGVDVSRVGIYGGSYGGFITLMALFTEPKAFAAGAALRAVTDWAHYNHWYTHRILNLPQGDTLAYRQSSPIYFAEGLERPLLIAHGMVDTNVHFQDVVRLAQRLIELHKTNWDMAVYPVESHGFIEPASWADEYRRILALFDTYLPGTARSKADGS